MQCNMYVHVYVRCGSGLCFASVASVMKKLTLLKYVYVRAARANNGKTWSLD
jgi:hypothetical protein